MAIFKKPFKSGANIDTRTQEEKDRDYRFEELVAKINPIEWKEKSQGEWRKFPIFNQNGSGSCVAQTMAKLMGILYWLKNQSYVHFSAADIYQKRSNRPQAGMSGIEAFDIARKGATLEDLVPSQNMTDAQMDGIIIPEYKEKVGEIFKIGNYLSVPIQDIDAIASIIQTTKKGVMVWFYFKIDEWTDTPQIKYPGLTVQTGERHSVTAVDFTLYNGQKALVIDDSWGSLYGKAGQRVITEEFFRIRNWFAAYPMNFAFDGVAEKPEYTFSKDLKLGDINNDVKALQNILKYEGMFPTNTDSTGKYGPVTAKGVMAFQTKYKVASGAEIASIQGRSVGPKTREKLNQLYGNS